MKRITLLFLSILISLSAFAQTYTNTKQLRFFAITTAGDTAATTANEGRMWFDYVSNKYRGNINGTNVTIGTGGGGGGGGTIAGSIASPQVAYGTASNTIGGDADFTFTADILTLNGIRFLRMPGTTANSGLAIGNGAGVTSTWSVADGRNIAIGTSSLSSMVDGALSFESSYNFAGGYRAGQGLTTGSRNVLIGHDVARLGTIFTNSVIIGANNASTGIVTGGSNTLLGYLIATPLTSGTQNTVGGYTSAQNLSTGNRNAFWGAGIAASCTSCSQNDISGSESWEYITTHTNNTGAGYWNGVYQIGNNNTTVGAFAMGQTTTVPTIGVTTLSNSTALGFGAGSNQGFGAETINGTDLLFVGTYSGYLTGVAAAGLTNAAAIGTGARVGLDNSMVIGGTSATYAINYGFGGESYGGGRGAIFVKNATTNPTSAPTAGYLTYANGGIGYIRNAGESAYPIGRNVFTTTGDIAYGVGTSETRLAAGTLGYVLTSGGPGVAPAWAASPAGFADPMTTRGDMIYRNAANATARLPVGTAGQFITTDGTDTFWGSSPSGWALTGTTTITGNTVVNFGATGSSPYTNEFRADNLTTTSTVGRGLVLNNNTAATGGATVQYSPSLTLRGNAWTGAASQTVDFKQYALTASAATPTGQWLLVSSVNGGADVVNMRVNNDGNSSGIQFNAGGASLLGTTNGILSLSGAGIVRFNGTQGTIQYNHVTGSVSIASGVISLRNLNANTGTTTGTHSEIGIGSGWNPASGTAAYNMVIANQTINNAGNGIASMFNIAPTWTATGSDAYFLNYNPTVTSITGTHYAARFTSGLFLLGGTSITAGSVLMDLQSTSRALLLSRATDAGITTEVDGMIFHNSSSNFLVHEGLGLKLGTDGRAGATRTIQADGSASSIDLVFTNKGTNRFYTFSPSAGSNANIEAGGGATALNLTAPTQVSIGGNSAGTQTGTIFSGTATVATHTAGDGIDITVATAASNISNTGDIVIQTGSTTGGNLTSGNITLQTGTKTGTGLHGDIIFESGNESTGTLKLNDGANEQMGVATLVGGTITVNNSKITANTRISMTHQAPGGTLGVVHISARVAGTSFTITSSSGSDTSVIFWQLWEPN